MKATSDLKEKILELKKKKNAVILRIIIKSKLFKKLLILWVIV